MIGLVARRLVETAAVVLVVSFFTFGLLYLAPGSPERALAGGRNLDAETREVIRHRYGLDRPFLVRYGDWLADAARLDFNVSTRTGEPVIAAIAERWKTSAFLGVYAFALTVVVGVPLGILAALRRGRAVDRGISTAALFLLCAPPFAVGILLLYGFAVALGILPVAGPGEGFLGRLEHLTLPAAAVAAGTIAVLMRLTRGSLIAELDQDYVTFARARGLSRRRTIYAHALRNAAIPLITQGGLLFGGMVTGALLVEVVFSLPGLGSLFVDSIAARDFPMIQGLTLFFATVIIVTNLLVDMSYFAIDPQIRRGKAEG